MILLTLISCYRTLARWMLSAHMYSFVMTGSGSVRNLTRMKSQIAGEDLGFLARRSKGADSGRGHLRGI